MESNTFNSEYGYIYKNTDTTMKDLHIYQNYRIYIIAGLGYIPALGQRLKPGYKPEL